MKFQFDIIARLKDVYAHRNEPEALRILAAYYWRGLLLVTFAVLIGVFLYGTWSLESVLDDLNAPPSSFSQPQLPLNHSQLTATLGAFTQRKARYESLKGGGEVFADPSH